MSLENINSLLGPSNIVYPAFHGKDRTCGVEFVEDMSGYEIWKKKRRKSDHSLNSNSTFESAVSRGRHDSYLTKGLGHLRRLAQVLF